jgi:adenylylsulfate kinase
VAIFAGLRAEMAVRIHEMSNSNPHIFPVHSELLQRSEKEALLGQRAISIWMTGLSGSGKTSIAKHLERKLHGRRILSALLDGDNIRDGINRNLGFSEDDRAENIRRIAEVNKLLNSTGIVVINCFVSPTKAIRSMARDIIGAEDFVEVFIDTPIQICEERDVKGLYAQARKGLIKNFTGIDAPFEIPESPTLTLPTSNRTPEACADELLAYIIPKIKHT